MSRSAVSSPAIAQGGGGGAAEEASFVPANFADDFLLISEFSELVGPVCLNVLPSEDDVGSFNIPKFVLKIMSVDHQAKSGESGVFVEDTQVVFHEVSESAYVYVHHLTLLDIFARGYVRPICFAYVTKDPSKIMSNFLLFRKWFTEVSNVWKTGNYNIFREDLKHRIADLAYTKEVAGMDGASAITAATPGILSRQLADAEKMNTKVRAERRFSPTEAIIERERAALEELSGNGKEEAQQQYSRTPPNNIVIPAVLDPGISPMKMALEGGGGLSSSSSDEEDTSFLPALNVSWQGSELGPHGDVLSDEGDIGEEGELEEDEDEEGDYLAEVMLNIVKALGISQDYKPKVIKSLHKTRTLSNKLRTLEEICGTEKWTEGMQQMRGIHRYFQRPSIALFLEREDIPSMVPASSMLAIGGIPMLNFNWRADRNVSGEKQVARENGTVISSSTVLSAGPESSAEDYDFRSFNSMVTASSSMSGIPHDLLDHTLAFAHGVIDPSAHSTGLPRRYSASSATLPPANIVIEDEGANHVLIAPRSESDSVSPATQSPPPSTVIAPRAFDAMNPMALENFVNSDVVDKSLPIVGLADRLWPSPDHSSAPPIDIFQIRRFSFARHLLFSLLKGRPVLILGSEMIENQVRDLVATLTVFVSGYWGRKLVAPLLDRAPRMSDLSQFKLMGLLKTHRVPKSVKRYVSVLDLDNDVLWAPKYSRGVFVEDLLDARRKWPNNDSYLSFIYSKLHELSIVACSYYYLCCVGVPASVLETGADSVDDTEADDGSSSPASSKSGKYQENTRATQFRKSLSTQYSAPLLEQPATTFFRERQIGPDDALIIQHLAEVVKEQQAHEIYGVAHVNPPIKLDHTPCSVFEDKLRTPKMRSVSVSAVTFGGGKKGALGK